MPISKKNVLKRNESIVGAQQVMREELKPIGKGLSNVGFSNVGLSNVGFSYESARNGINPRVDTKELFGAFLDQFDEIKTGDYVRIIGKDMYKGHIGLVEGIYMSVRNYIVYKVQLQTNGETVDRERHSLKKFF